MRFVTTKKALRQALGKIEGIPRKTACYTAANYLLFSVEDSETIGITASSDECSAKVTFRGDVTEKGECAVHGLAVLDIAKVLPDAPIICETLPTGHVRLSAASAVYTILATDPLNVPVLDPPVGDVTLRLPSHLVHEIYDSVAFACATNPIRPELCGVLLRVLDGTAGPMLEAVATDGYRLARLTRPIPAENVRDVTVSMLISAKTIARLRDFVDESRDVVDILCQKGTVWFRQSADYLRTYNIDARYPDYERVLAMPQSITITVDRQALQTAIQRAKAVLFAGQQYFVHLLFHHDQAVVMVSDPNGGEVRVELGLERGADRPLKVALDAGYLGQALRAISSDMVTIAGDGALSPVFLWGGNDGGLHVIMPARI